MPFAAGPVAGRQVVQHLRQAVAVEFAAQRRLIEVVGKEIFNAFETRPGGQCETVEKRRLVEQHRQVRSKSRHAITPLW